MKIVVFAGVLLSALVETGWSQTAKSAAESKVFSIKNYGAVGDGVAMETEAVQKTNDACHDAGGGVIWVPAGDFQIGTIILKSNVTLSLY